MWPASQVEVVEAHICPMPAKVVAGACVLVLKVAVKVSAAEIELAMPLMPKTGTMLPVKSWVEATMAIALVTAVRESLTPPVPNLASLNHRIDELDRAHEFPRDPGIAGKGGE